PDIPLRFSRIMQEKTHRFNRALQSLDQLSPLSVMRRGYSIVLDSEKRIIRSVSETSEGSGIQVLMRDGSLSCTVDSIRKGDSIGKEEERA
ncbi:MAG TPA: exodeoxyribonuclease VII large subunit, partial [Spirochaetota bacterium]|nr:exodeoxyribonuclease VII large subunit [Spirochaetota bacterium]